MHAQEKAAQFDDDQDILDAYVACGGVIEEGNPVGHVSRDTLVKIIKHDFGLSTPQHATLRATEHQRGRVGTPPSNAKARTNFRSAARTRGRDYGGHVCCAVVAGLTINIEELIDAIDTDGSGEIEYPEFKLLMSGS